MESSSTRLALTAAAVFLYSCGGGGGAADKGSRPDAPLVIGGDTGLAVVDYGLKDDDASGTGDLHEGSDPQEAGDAEAAHQDAEAAHQDAEIAPNDLASDPGDPGPADTQLTDGVCVPSCSGKECGNDGCGGKCGTCAENEDCIASKCVCIPGCSQKECGDDGCGGSCGECGEGVVCLDGKCLSAGPCPEVSYTLTCIDSNINGNNGWKPNGDKMNVYACAPGRLAHGPEKAYRFVPDQSGRIDVTLDSAVDFLDVYVIRDEGHGCHSDSCIAWGHTSVTVQVEEGHTYWLVVDATENQTTGLLGYDLYLDCDWTPLQADP